MAQRVDSQLTLPHRYNLNYKDSIHKDYEIKEEIGRGAFSVCRRCVHRSSGKEYAVKVSKVFSFAMRFRNSATPSLTTITAQNESDELTPSLISTDRGQV